MEMLVVRPLAVLAVSQDVLHARLELAAMLERVRLAFVCIAFSYSTLRLAIIALGD
jgi:hypothetical protein